MLALIIILQELQELFLAPGVAQTPLAPPDALRGLPGPPGAPMTHHPTPHIRLFGNV